MTKLNLNLPMYQLLVQCQSCKNKRTIDKRAWDFTYWYLYGICPSCSPSAEKSFEILDAHLINDNVPLLPGEQDPNEAKTYSIYLMKTGGWIGQGYVFHSRIGYDNSAKSLGDLEYMPCTYPLSNARVFISLRSVKSTISRFVNKSGKVLQRSDFKVFEVNSAPTQEIKI